MSIEATPLKNAGDAVTLTVSACGLVPYGKFPEVEFLGTDGGRSVRVLVPQSSADRQLKRIPLTYAECVGKKLTISRDPNATSPAKPYWGVTLVGTVTPSTAGSPPAAQPPAPSTQEPKPTPAVQAPALYTRITRFVLDEIVPLYVEAGIQPTANDIHAMVSTIYITASKR